MADVKIHIGTIYRPVRFRFLKFSVMKPVVIRFTETITDYSAQTYTSGIYISESIPPIILDTSYLIYTFSYASHTHTHIILLFERVRRGQTDPTTFVFASFVSTTCIRFSLKSIIIILAYFHFNSINRSHTLFVAQRAGFRQSDDVR